MKRTRLDSSHLLKDNDSFLNVIVTIPDRWTNTSSGQEMAKQRDKEALANTRKMPMKPFRGRVVFERDPITGILIDVTCPSLAYYDISAHFSNHFQSKKTPQKILHNYPTVEYLRETESEKPVCSLVPRHTLP